jgi:hypothetical protein
MNAPVDPPPPPDECPACDEPTADVGWDAELEVCRACAEAFQEEEALREDQENNGWEGEHDDEEPP